MMEAATAEHNSGSVGKLRTMERHVQSSVERRHAEEHAS